ncbi:MAG: hypothetical protein B7X48_13535 [Acidiphilium sp. 34-60-192]|nr:MAG: hypothetical protein B7X48_13535 [Acidiphilium sp. 34-60-192]
MSARLLILIKQSASGQAPLTWVILRRGCDLRRTLVAVAAVKSAQPGVRRADPVAEGVSADDLYHTMSE